MKLSLVATQGKGAGKVIPISVAEFVVGRDPQCHLRPASPLISKRHCSILIRGDKAFVRDFDSTNGTFINDQPIKGEVELHNEERLRIGPLELLVRLEVKPITKTVPKPQPQAPAAGAEDEDSFAALLLDGPDAGGGASPEGGGGDSGLSDTTMMDIPALQGTATQPAKPEEKKKEEPKKPDNSTSNAARKILEKFARRSRG